MKKSTIIKYLELQSTNLEKMEAKKNEVNSLKAEQDAETNDEKWEELDNQIEFSLMEWNTYEEENERISYKLSTFRKSSKENKQIFREANAEYKAGYPDSTKAIQIMAVPNWTSEHQRMHDIYTGRN